LSEATSTKIEPNALIEFLAWVHSESHSEELTVIQSEVLERLKLTPAPAARAIVLSGQRVAGAYFTCLPGRLAILGAVRTITQHEQLGSRLLVELATELSHEYKVELVQAAVADVDFAAQQMLEAAGFRYLATVDQMWLSPIVATSIDDATQGQQHSAWQPRWTDMSEVAEANFLTLLESTFQESLDCPELNNLRSIRDVLDSFLLGRRFSELKNWRVAWEGRRMIGCLILEEHENSVSEIVYMGLAPSARHRGMGKQLVGQAVERALSQGLSGVALAVDMRNVPAIKTYVRCGFRPLRRLKVYLIRSGKPHAA